MGSVPGNRIAKVVVCLVKVFSISMLSHSSYAL